jgi:hypothetical protein
MSVTGGHEWYLVGFGGIWWDLVGLGGIWCRQTLSEIGGRGNR